MLHKQVIVLMFYALILGGCQNSSVVGKSLLSSVGAVNVIPEPAPTPGGGSGPSVTINAKVFFKSPTFAAQQPMGFSFSCSQDSDPNYLDCSASPSTARNYDTYFSDVAITGTQGGFLKNSDIEVLPDFVDESTSGTMTVRSSGFSKAQADANGHWYFSSVGDSSFRLGQLMAYYWINNEKDAASSILTNGWHATGKNVKVYSHCYDATRSLDGVNAFWSGISYNLVCMSFLGPFESAYDASVYDHEMGHANIDYATAGQINSGQTEIQCSGSSNACCPNADGCGGAINEGQADVHAYIVFNSGVIGEHFMNNLSGLNRRNADANLQLSPPMTAQSVYNITGEIHSMGGVWGTAWWDLYKTLGAEPTKKLFFAHLEGLTGSDTFKTALREIINVDQQLVNSGVFASNHASTIQTVFARHGITPSL